MERHFFCGSCAIIRRGPLEEIGGIAIETVTEDAHTALKLNRRGYSTAYLNITQAAGLATESLSAHIGQRIRWARGMAQIFRLDNPFLGKGLSFFSAFATAIRCYIFLRHPSPDFSDSPTVLPMVWHAHYQHRSYLHSDLRTAAHRPFQHC